MKNKLLKIIGYYGIKNQIKKFNEESFELMEAMIEEIYLSHIFRNLLTDSDDKQHIKEEIADNLVLLSQFILYYNINLDDIEKIFKYKVNRQLERIKAENE